MYRILISILFIYTRTDNYRRTKLSLSQDRQVNRVSMRLGDATLDTVQSTCPGSRHVHISSCHTAVTCRGSRTRAPRSEQDQRTCQPGRRPAPQTPAPQTPTACQGDPSARTIGGGRWSRLSRAASVCYFAVYKAVAKASVTALPRTRRAVVRVGVRVRGRARARVRVRVRVPKPSPKPKSSLSPSSTPSPDPQPEPHCPGKLASERRAFVSREAWLFYHEVPTLAEYHA